MPHSDADKRREYAREYYRKWRAENPEKVQEALRKSAERRREAKNAQRKEDYWANLEESRAKAREKYDPETAHAYYLANKAKINARVNAYRAANPEAARARNAAWYVANREHMAALRKAWRDTHREYISAKSSRTLRELKLDVWSHYGGAVCACCGTTEILFLTIDHINGGGSKHRRELKEAGTNVYDWLKRNNYPEGYQVLCMNCNFARGMYGRCPHQQE